MKRKEEAKKAKSKKPASAPPDVPASSEGRAPAESPAVAERRPGESPEMRRRRKEAGDHSDDDDEKSGKPKKERMRPEDEEPEAGKDTAEKAPARPRLGSGWKKPEGELQVGRHLRMSSAARTLRPNPLANLTDFPPSACRCRCRRWAGPLTRS